MIYLFLARRYKMKDLISNHQIGEKLSTLIRDERRITNEILTLINLALDRRAYLDLGFSSMFDWLVKGFGFSSSSAYRRIEAARLLKSVPEATQMLEEGRVNLSTLCKVQTVIKQQEKMTGEKISNAIKEEIVKTIENKSVLETEQTMVSIFPETTSLIKQERHTIINEHFTRIQLNFPNIAIENLKRAKELLSHKFPNANDSDVLVYALKLLVDKMAPMTREAAEAEVPSVKSIAADNGITNIGDEINGSADKKVMKNSKAGQRRIVFKDSGGKCTFKDHLTGQVCGSRYQVQLDHIIPRALGGGDDPSNLRVLCRQHNLLMAERVFGKKLMDHYRGLS